MNKRHIIKSYKNLPFEMKRSLRNKYPDGFGKNVQRIPSANGTVYYALPHETDDASYLIKLTLSQIENADVDEDDFNEKIESIDIVDTID